MAVDFSAEEAATLKRWREIDAFQTQVALSRGKPAYTFFDGESPTFDTRSMLTKSQDRPLQRVFLTMAISSRLLSRTSSHATGP